MTKEDFIRMLHNGVPPFVVINHMALYYDNLFTESFENNTCETCVDKDDCDTLTWLDKGIKNASRHAIEDNFMKRCRCIYYKKKE
jgi:hypothetical protein